MKPRMNDRISRLLLSPTFQSALRHRIHRCADVDDAIQDTWLKANDLPVPPDRDTFTWLLRIAINCAKDNCKRERRLKRREKEPDVFRQKPGCQDFLGFTVPVDTTFPGHKLERSDLQNAIRQKICAAGLPDRYRNALWDRLNENPARVEVSQKPSATLRVWAMRARERLRPAMQRAGLDNEI